MQASDAALALHLQVFQLETAMGSAIESFDDSGAVVVPRSRFAPVKTTNDLFVLRSDAYNVRRRPSAQVAADSFGRWHSLPGAAHPALPLTCVA